MPARYLIGIDLGTTNSVLAYIDTQDEAASIRVFPVPQLVAHGEVRTLPALPSFIYFPTAEELSGGSVVATWNEDPPMVTGVLAREQGSLVPSRQVSSAKSWLSYPGVDRRARILPAQAEPPHPTISPVEASARYLMHLRDAWNTAFGNDPESRLERQDVVLTVPASFDEEARELTVEAARRAGLETLTLLEEPLAAFYAWIADNPDAQSAGEELRDGELILICDIGGGTSDFSLLRARLASGELQCSLQFERTAIGEHLLLGGDNFDLALARLVEAKVKETKLSLRQRYALRLSCSAAKERLLSDSSLERVPVTILGSGRTVVGQAVSVGITRDEVLEVLTAGFLPITAPDEMPVRGRAAGLRELGLPYASDPAITKHLAAFLAQAAAAMNGGSASRLVRPGAVLFNGGFCAPVVVRHRLLDAISSWFGAAQSGWRPKLLNNDAVESAVARGAAHYGWVRRGAAARIRAGNARSYYVALPSRDSLQAICVLPAGVEEGTTLPLVNREFSVLANRPVSFTLYSSRTRHDAQGDIVSLDEAAVHRHAPLVTLLRYGKKLRELQLTIRLRATFTEVGTLELWCESRDTPHRWRLQFELRSEEARAEQVEAPLPSGAAMQSPAPILDEAVEPALQLVRRAFEPRAAERTAHVVADNLVSDMEAALGLKRDAWPLTAARQVADVLIGVAAGRSHSPRDEARWLNLAGFCARPGFGAPADPARVGQLRTLVVNGPVFLGDVPSEVQTLVLLRRIAGGINAADQQALYRRYAPSVGIGVGRGNKRTRINRQIEYEAWRLLASLEHLPASTRTALGRELLQRIRKEPGDAIWLWVLGRLGARIPLYGPLRCVVAPDIAGAWLENILDIAGASAALANAAVMMAHRTDDRSRDLDDAVRQHAIARLAALGTAESTMQPLSAYVAPDFADAVRSFGESLPPGLQLVSSSSCLLSVPALHSSQPTLLRPA